MSFFYNLNKRLADLSAKQDAAQLTESAAVAEGSTGDYSAKKAAAGKDIGKPGKMFSKIAKSAGKEYGSKAAGERVAGAVLNKLRGKTNEADMEEGNEFSGELAKAKANGAKEFKVDGKSYPVKEASINIPGASMPTGPFDNSHWLDITTSKDKNFKVAKPGHELDGKTVTVIAYSKNGKTVVVDFEGQRYNVSPRDLEQRKKVKEAKAKPDYIDLDRDGNRKETMKKAAADKKKSKSAGTAFDPETARSMFANKDEHPRYNVKDTGYSKVYTRKHEEEPESDDDNKSTDDAPKRRGRPKGKDKGPERVTSKSYKYKSGRPTKTKEDLDSDGVMMTRPSNMSSEDIEMDSIALVDKGEYDREGDMAKEQLHTIKLAAKELASILSDDENLPEWVQSKITKAMDYIDTARDYMIATKADMQPVAEKAVSKAQRAAAGIAYAAAKGDIPKKELRGASKEMAKMPAGELKKFAKTKEKGLPEKVKEADAEAKPAKKGGFEFGKGVYESMNGKVESMITESMNVNISMSSGQNGEPTKSITVSAEGEDAEALAALLKMAGLSNSGEGCPTCGKGSCGCEELDENSPDWPTNTETSDNALQYSGGLNGPKSTGQTTVPVIASQLRRQVSMEEGIKLEQNLFKLYKNYKAQ